MQRLTFLLLVTLLFPFFVTAKEYVLTSPDGKITTTIQSDLGKTLYSVTFDGRQVIAPSAIGMSFSTGTHFLMGNPAVASVKKSSGDEIIPTPLYRSREIKAAWNELNILFKDKSGVIFRVYNEGVAYRFYTAFSKPGTLYITGELAEVNFEKDYPAWISYSPTPANPLCMSFQNYYTHHKLSEFPKENLAFSPLTVDLGDGLKATLTESDLKGYPGMFFQHATPQAGTGISGTFAAYPKEFQIHPRRCQKKVTGREKHIAVSNGNREYPWRVIAITSDDRQLPDNPLVYALAQPNAIGETSWIKPGKIAWDWWNDWGISGVDFKVGINNRTYQYFIDFAASNGIEYVVLDEGWSEPGKGDVMTSIPDINVKELVEYGKSKNVGIILWVVLNVLDDKLEEACAHYAALGVKGFKVDFLDRDDQEGVEMVRRVAAAAARHKLLIDLHGSYKPAGLNRTYPNIINIEGVFGLEELKWSKPDMPLYDVTMPFIRMMSGPVDYTQGAMRNATQKEFRDIYTAPMSQGTRAHQVATYVVFDAPLVTLCDSPTAYLANQPTLNFITSLPVVFDETRILQGELGEYIVTARRVGDNWYIGGLTNWTPRDLEIPLDFLSGDYQGEIFADGMNAAKVAQDYQITQQPANAQTVLKLHLASGGGFAVKLLKK